MDWSNKTILLTGGTGSFGQRFVEVALAHYSPKVIRVYSRDELKQVKMMERINDKRLRFFIGDVRDGERLRRAMADADIVVHAAALKQVPVCEYNPIEAVNTNVLGAENIINCAIDQKVPRVIALSTDKAVNPVNLYGATKLCAEKLFVAANAYVGYGKTRFSIVRYGNVVGSRGSVIPLFLRQKRNGMLTITDRRMTRFWIDLDQAIDFVTIALKQMQGGEIFIPKIPTMSVMDLATAIDSNCQLKFIGIRPGEKIHEVLITEDEARHTLEFPKYYVVEPENPAWSRKPIRGGRPVPEGFRYTSDTNTQRLTKEQLKELLQHVDVEN